METDSTVCKVMILFCVLMAATTLIACEFACDPEGRGERGYNRTCVEPDSELDSYGCPVGRGGPTDYPYLTEPIGCDEQYDLIDHDTERFAGTCCDWEVSFDGYEQWCLWVDYCSWEFERDHKYKQSSHYR